MMKRRSDWLLEVARSCLHALQRGIADGDSWRRMGSERWNRKQGKEREGCYRSALTMLIFSPTLKLKMKVHARHREGDVCNDWVREKVDAGKGPYEL